MLFCFEQKNISHLHTAFSAASFTITKNGNSSSVHGQRKDKAWSVHSALKREES